jgi:hypothetical protein
VIDAHGINQHRTKEVIITMITGEIEVGAGVGIEEVEKEGAENKEARNDIVENEG